MITGRVKRILIIAGDEHKKRISKKLCKNIYYLKEESDQKNKFCAFMNDFNWRREKFSELFSWECARKEKNLSGKVTHKDDKL